MTNIIHDSLRFDYGLSRNAPEEVIRYSLNTGLFEDAFNFVDGTDDNDQLTIETVDEWMFGFDGDDTLHGTSSSGDYIVSPRMVGGEGRDTFVIYDRPNAHYRYTDADIADFQVGLDKINLANFSTLASMHQLSINTYTQRALYDTDLVTFRITEMFSINSGLTLRVINLASERALNDSDFIFAWQNANVPPLPVIETPEPLPEPAPEPEPGPTLEPAPQPSAPDVINFVPDETIYGSEGADVIRGNNHRDLIYGGRSQSDPDDVGDTIIGGTDDDLIYANGGDDLVYGGVNASNTASDGNDIAYGGLGNDTLYGGGQNDTLYGGGNRYAPDDQDDKIYGGNDNDELYGNGGNDTLYAGLGNDWLHGGYGDDTYYFNATDNSNVIAHFEGAGEFGGDVIAFNISNIAYDNIISVMTQQGGDTVITLSNLSSSFNTAVRIEDVTPTQFTADDILIV